jgi:hypothetical protein
MSAEILAQFARRSTIVRRFILWSPGLLCALATTLSGFASVAQDLETFDRNVDAAIERLIDDLQANELNTRHRAALALELWGIPL